MKRVTLTVEFDVDVPDEVDTEDLCLDLFDYAPLSIALASDYGSVVDAEIVSHYTTDVTEILNDVDAL